VTKSPISGSGKINYIRPYYGNWIASIVQSSKTISSSNQFTGQLCTAPTLGINVDQQCSSSKLITITAQDTQPGMILTAQATNTKSQVYLVVDSTPTNDPLVLQFQRPSPEGLWTARLTFGNHTFAEESFEVSLCVAAEISVDLTNTCSKGVTINWKNAPEGSYIAIVPSGSVWVYSYAPTTGTNGNVTFLLENGQYEAVLASHAFEAISFTDEFLVNCKVSVPVPVLILNGVTSTTATLSWTSLSNYGIYIYNLAVSRDNTNWFQITLYFQTEVNVIQLLPNTVYFSKVQAVSDSGPGEWSSAIRFQTTA